MPIMAAGGQTWLFSFALYYDPEQWVWPLEVINDDIVAPTQGFGQHGHRDMDPVLYR